ncbi:MAG: hypothetical protein RLZZ385_462 [Pseudomonadota bacterium]|jgi:aspartate/methionine/tyrosine aminotransferase
MTGHLISAADRTRSVNPFRVMDVLRRARELEAAGVDVVHLEVGEPDFSTAQPIIDAAHAALDKGLTQYSAAAGLPVLREAVSAWYSRRHGLTIDSRRIFITPGASGGLNLLANLLINPGDGVLLADPSYPCNRNFIRLMGGQPQLIPVTPATRFQVDVALLESHATAATRGVWVASPGNPTGTCVDRAGLRAISQWATARGCHLLLDEIYHGLHYIEDLPSLLEIDQGGFVVNSFSKYFGMTGWRIGWIVVPDNFVDKADILAQNLFIAASTIAQHAALAAFADETLEILEQRREEFRRRRDYLSNALRGLGFTIPITTDGAFYVYAGIENFSADSEAFCRDLLENHGVAITPGTDFGDFHSGRYVRMAFTNNMSQLEKAVERLRAALV